MSASSLQPLLFAPLTATSTDAPASSRPPSPSFPLSPIPEPPKAPPKFPRPPRTGMHDIDELFERADFFAEPAPGLQVFDLTRVMRDEQAARTRRAELALSAAATRARLFGTAPPLPGVWERELAAATRDGGGAETRVDVVRGILEERGIAVPREMSLEEELGIDEDFMGGAEWRPEHAQVYGLGHYKVREYLARQGLLGRVARPGPSSGMGFMEHTASTAPNAA